MIGIFSYSTTLIIEFESFLCSDCRSGKTVQVHLWQYSSEPEMETDYCRNVVATVPGVGKHKHSFGLESSER